MTLNIPYSFTPGTKAKAQEVNENFNYVLEKIANGASNDFSDLTEEAEKHFINKQQLTNCILEAPNGIATYTESTLTVKAGLKILIPNGRNDDGTLNNLEYTFPSDVHISAGTGAKCFYVFAGQDCRNTSEGMYIISDEEPTKANMYNTWFSPKDNIIKITNDAGETWTPIKGAFIGIYTLDTDNKISSFKPLGTVSLAKEDEIDGCWHYLGTNIATNVSVNGSTALSYDLSSYIPKDNYLYEIILQGAIEPVATQNSYCALLVSTSFTPNGNYYLTRARGVNNVQNSNGSISNFILGSNKIMTVSRSTAYQGTATINLIAYRKVR